MTTFNKVLATCALALLTIAPNKSQAQAFGVGDNVFGVGVGIGGTYNYGWRGAGFSRSPIINAQFEHGLMELGDGVLGIGAMLGYSTAKYDYLSLGYNHKYRFSSMLVAARGTWHYNDWHGDNRLDTYAAVALGLYFHSSNFKYAHTGNAPFVASAFRDYSSTSTSGYFGVQVGARYWFTPKVSAYAELGYAMSWLQAGVAFKF